MEKKNLKSEDIEFIYTWVLSAASLELSENNVWLKDVSNATARRFNPSAVKTLDAYQRT